MLKTTGLPIFFSFGSGIFFHIGYHFNTHLDILFCQITTFIKVRTAFVFGLQPLKLIDFTKIFQLKGLKPKNKGHTNFYECCDLTKKVYLTLQLRATSYKNAIKSDQSAIFPMPIFYDKRLVRWFYRWPLIIHTYIGTFRKYFPKKSLMLWIENLRMKEDSICMVDICNQKKYIAWLYV